MNRSDEQAQREMLERLNQQMKVLDEAYEPVNIPSLASLEAQVKERRQSKRRADRVEMLLFWLVGIMLLTLGALLIRSSPAVYLGIQALSVVAAIAIALILVGKRKETTHE
ncbi:YxlC family protein [Paenibacillus sp. ACRSA]|uniref:YxlC family protein n=1 Tax=Paenibacillus sp. ACRSA TaxID=2918211 RepID=UPI001EF3DD08|nr:YxlC family protein [Paenibacillus sp. ACRSA]MCG7380316.1 YxlC family protein [Paenibacillus sp. ACRSA]